MTEIYEFAMKKYKKIGVKPIMITDLMFDLAEFNVFELAKNYPDTIKKSVEQIEQLRADFRKGDKFPPIKIEMRGDEFVTIVDGFHRLLAYRDEGARVTEALILERYEQ